MTINQNLISSEPALKDLIPQILKTVGIAFQCHHVGTIISFDASNQTCQVSVNYKKSVFQANAAGEIVEQLVNYPTLADVPVLFIGGGQGVLTFPVAAGDECIVLFNDRDFDNWLTTGNTGAASNSPRLHSLSDGMAVVGLRSYPNAISDFNEEVPEFRSLDGTTAFSPGADAATMRADTTTAKVNTGGKFIVTNPTGEMLAALDAMFTALQAATAGGYPLLLPPDFATNFAIFQSFKE